MPEARAAMAQTLATEWGLPILILREGDKRPLYKGEFEAQATRDPERIQAELGNGSKLNYGIAWGPIADMFALDVDQGGTETIASLEWEHGPLPPTWRIITQSGAYQDIFHWPHDGGPPIRNRGRFAPSLDVRGQGGQSVGPESEYIDRSTGEVRPWRWAPGRAPWEIDLAEMPAAWLGLIRAQQAAKPEPKPAKPAPPQARNRLEAFAASVMDAKLSALANAPDGEQEKHLGHAALKAGSLIARGWISRSYCEQAIVATILNCQNYEPGYPWTHADATYKVARGIEKGERSPEPDPPWLAEIEERERPREHLRGIPGGKSNGSSQGASEWPHAETNDEPEPETLVLMPYVPEAAADIEPRRWVCGDELARGYVSVDIGAPGVGKSQRALQQGLALALGKPLLGQACARYRVGYWNGEDPMHENRLRVAAVLKHHKLDGADLEGWFFWGSGRDAQIVLAATQVRGAVEVNEAMVQRVIRTIRAQGLDVLIIDPFVSSHRVPENDNMAIDLVVKTWARIAEECDIAVKLVHHPRKTNGEQVTIEDSRGGGALVAGARVARLLNQMTEDEARGAGIHPDQRRAYIRVDHGKANLAPPAATTWLKFVSVDLENGGPDGGLGDSVGVLVSWKYPPALAGITPAHVLQVQQDIDARPDHWRDSNQAIDWVGFCIADTLGFDVGQGIKKAADRSVEQNAARARVQTLLNTWLGSGLLKTVDGDDDHGMPRKFVTVGKWIDPT